MAQIVIQIPDAVTARVQAAYGAANLQDVANELRQIIRNKVINHEITKAREDKLDTLKGENW